MGVIVVIMNAMSEMFVVRDGTNFTLGLVPDDQAVIYLYMRLCRLICVRGQVSRSHLGFVANFPQFKPPSIIGLTK